MRSDSTFAARGYSTTWWCSAMSQQARGNCAVTISMPRTCSTGIMTERVGEREVGVRVRVQENDPEAVLAVRRQDHGKDFAPHVRSRPWRKMAVRSRQTSPSRPRAASSASRERLTQARIGAIDDTNARALKRVDGRQGADLAKPAVRADVEIEPRGIGPVHDVDVVIAGNDEHAVGEPGMGGHGVEKFGPFGGAARIGGIARDRGRIERLRCIDLFERSKVRCRRALPLGPDLPLSIRKP